MRVVYRAANLIDAQLIADALRDEGMACEVTGGYLSGAIGELPPTDVVAVRIRDVADEARAKDLVRDIEAARRHPRPDWDCETCGERSGGAFGACWNCGHPAPPTSAAGPDPESGSVPGGGTQTKAF